MQKHRGIRRGMDGMPVFTARFLLILTAEEGQRWLYLKHELRLRMDEEFDCYEVDVSEESTA